MGDPVSASLVVRLPFRIQGDLTREVLDGHNTVAVAFHESFRNRPSDVGVILRCRDDHSVRLKRDRRVLEYGQDITIVAPEVVLDPNDLRWDSGSESFSEGREEEDGVQPHPRPSRRAAGRLAQAQHDLPEHGRKRLWDLVPMYTWLLVVWIVLEALGKGAFVGNRSDKTIISTPGTAIPGTDLDLTNSLVSGLESMMNITKEHIILPHGLHIDVYGTFTYGQVGVGMGDKNILEQFDNALFNICDYIRGEDRPGLFGKTHRIRDQAEPICRDALKNSKAAREDYQHLHNMLIGDLGRDAAFPTLSSHIALALEALAADMNHMLNVSSTHTMPAIHTERNRHIARALKRYLARSAIDDGKLTRPFADISALQQSVLRAEGAVTAARWLTPIAIGRDEILVGVMGKMARLVGGLTPNGVVGRLCGDLDAKLGLFMGDMDPYVEQGSSAIAELERTLSMAVDVVENARRQVEVVQRVLDIVPRLVVGLDEVEKTGWEMVGGRRTGFDLALIARAAERLSREFVAHVASVASKVARSSDRGESHRPNIEAVS